MNSETTKIEEGECTNSFDVTVLITLIPVTSALEVIKDRLEQDKELPNRTILSASYIIQLLEFCLNNTNFCLKTNFLSKPKVLSWGHL